MVETSQLTQKAKRYLPEFDNNLFEAACGFAQEAHRGQFRKSGQPYIIHPFETAQILMKYHADQDTLIAAVLHDVPEDTNRTLSEIDERFGKRIAFLVEGITKLSKVHYRHNMEQRQIESLKKLLLHSIRDIRVILIKLADRLHNMRTLSYIDTPEKRTRIAKETLEIYVPISNLLGLGQIKAEIENLCFQYLYPHAYEKIEQEIKAGTIDYGKYLKEMREIVQVELEKNGIHAQVMGRQKTYYSIYQKLYNLNKKFPDIDDILAFRVITATKEDCYRTLGIIHLLFKPKPNSFRDYIAVPKINRYQSLHTTVFGLDGLPGEFQIRTEKMNLEAECGIAAHYFYQGHQQQSEDVDQQLNKNSWWVRKILSIQKELKDNKDFMDNLRLDVFQDRIFTFTPKGDVVDLPQGATAIDFAYALHSEIGHHAERAVINGEQVTLHEKLQNGDSVTIVTEAAQHGPKRGWLDFSQTTLARHKIKEWLKKESRDKKIKLGKYFLQKELSRAGKKLSSELTSVRIDSLLKDFKKNNLDELFISVAEGNIDPKLVLKTIYTQESSEEFFGKIMKKHSGSPHEIHYRADVHVLMKDEIGNLSRVLSLISEQNVNLIDIKTKPCPGKKLFLAKLLMEVVSFDQLSKVFAELEELDCVVDVSRVFLSRKNLFLWWSAITTILWAFPLIFFLNAFETHFRGSVILEIGSYFAIGSLFLLLLGLHYTLHRSIPSVSQTSFYIIAASIPMMLSVLVVLGELLIFDILSPASVALTSLLILYYLAIGILWMRWLKYGIAEEVV